jgi:hypothetical protein
MTEASGVEQIMRPGGPGAAPLPALTRVEAETRFVAIRKEPGWWDRFRAGGAKERQEYEQINNAMRVDLNIQGGSAAAAIQGVAQQIADRALVEATRQSTISPRSSCKSLPSENRSPKVCATKRAATSGIGAKTRPGLRA